MGTIPLCPVRSHMSDTEGPLLPAPQQSPVRTFFLGANGLRAGWRLLIYFALLFVLFAALSPIAKRTFGRMRQDFSATTVIVSELFTFLVIVIATLIMARFERRTVTDYGLPPR